MDVVALVPSSNHASTRYRVIAFADHLARRGIRLQLEPIERSWIRRLPQLAQHRPDQVVILQRKLLPVWQLLLLRRSCPRLVYDFDDAVFLHDSFHRRGSFSLTRTVRFAAAVSLVDHVLAGNRFLASYACRWTSAHKVEVIPTCVDATRYPTATHVDRQPTRLVWIGSSSTLRSLETARPLLEGIGEAIPHMSLRVICDRFPRFRHLAVEPAHWSSIRETDQLRESDIGLSWLADDAWSRGKCGLKILQYMAAGLPVVASPVGVHRDIVGDDHGFLPRSPLAWIETMKRLVRDASLRNQMGRAGRERIEKHFAPRRWADTLADQLFNVAMGV